MTANIRPRISVIVPVLNNVATLQECLDSICQQDSSGGGVEIIVIDGGSTDGTLEVINRYSPHIVYWETGRDTGLSDAFNRGLARASGELIAILNSDDTWFSDTVRHVEAAVTQDPHADIYYGQIRYLDPLTGRSYIRSPDLSRMKQRMNLFHPAMYVRKTGYERVGGYSTDYRLAMDSEWCHRALQAGLRFHRVDSVLATMRLGGQSDKDFRGSLLEYRASLLCHGLSGRLAAGYYFTKYYLLKLLTRPYYLRLLKQVILR